MNILTLIILGGLAIFAFRGMKRGLVRKLGGIVSILVSSLLVTMLLPTVTQTIRTQTPVYEILRTQCRWIAETRLKSLADEADDDGDYVEYTEEITLDSLSRIDQTRLISSLPLPEGVQRLMQSFNNSSGYKKLDASGFGDYLAGFFADIIINIGAFIITLIIAHLIIWGVITALDLFAKLPFLYTINRAGGFAAGLIEGIIILWLFFLLLSACSGTEIGGKLMAMVEESAVLKPLYDHNLFLHEITGVISQML